MIESFLEFSSHLHLILVVPHDFRMNFSFFLDIVIKIDYFLFQLFLFELVPQLVLFNLDSKPRFFKFKSTCVFFYQFL
jgi:hypothetical protein